MTVLQALFLGAVQGLTEFFPVSSSGHLVIAEELLHTGFDAEDLLGFDILLHAATALALLLIYRRTWTDIALAPLRRDGANLKLLALLITASVPAGIIGVLFEDQITEIFRSLHMVAGAFCMTGIVLIVGPRFARGKASDQDTWRTALIMGIAQAIAIVPGLSRSGLTIAAGQGSGLSRARAMDFSFLMATPVILGATLLTMIEAWRGGMILPSATACAVGFTTSFFSSIFAVFFLRSFVVRFGLEWFALYLIPAGGFLLIAVN